MDNILKNYSRKTKVDEAMHILNTVEHDGFDPYYWVSRSSGGMKFNIYSKGIVCMSVCASKEMSRSEIERRANAENPTGLEHGWRISKDATFEGGEPMPGVCESDDTCQHWLLNC